MQEREAFLSKPAIPIEMLQSSGWPGGYALLDSGHGQKLERWGALTLARPETQALWTPTLSEAEWAKADAVFDATVEDDEHGRWRVNAPERASWTVPYVSSRTSPSFVTRAGRAPQDEAERVETKNTLHPEEPPKAASRRMEACDVSNEFPQSPPRSPATGDVLLFECRFTNFRHVGLFPEQAPHWEWMRERIAARRTSGAPFRVLNLFGYTGAASLIAAAAGAEVVHVDASKKAIEWARVNQSLSKLEEKPIRWICDDALAFAAREGRRGSRYDGIVLDPPKFGRGPKNEKWELFESLPMLLKICSELLTPKASFMILTAYAVRLSYLSLRELMRDATRGEQIDAGELILREEAGARFLSTSLYARWAGDNP